MIITIDGPTGSGKSSAARGLAKKLNFYCLSSGLLYRALAYILLNNFDYAQNQLENPSLQDLEHALDPTLFMYHLEKDSCGWMSYAGKNISTQLKSDEVSQGASIIATNQEVRNRLSALQRDLAKNKDLVLEGRDSGSIVFDKADVKFYLTAQLQERAKRWQQVQKKHGQEITYKQAKEHVLERDHRDQNREIAPLIIPKDAIIIDNTHLTLDGTIDKMMSYIRK